MNPARRQFLASSSAFTRRALCGPVALGKSLLAAPSSAANRELYGKALIARMKWFNESGSARHPEINLWSPRNPRRITGARLSCRLPAILVWKVVWLENTPRFTIKWA